MLHQEAALQSLQCSTVLPCPNSLTIKSFVVTFAGEVNLKLLPKTGFMNEHQHCGQVNRFKIRVSHLYSAADIFAHFTHVSESLQIYRPLRFSGCFNEVSYYAFKHRSNIGWYYHLPHCGGLLEVRRSAVHFPRNSSERDEQKVTVFSFFFFKPDVAQVIVVCSLRPTSMRDCDMSFVKKETGDLIGMGIPQIECYQASSASR